MVTLPQHNRLDALSHDLRTKWHRFAARVAAHEQRHVDIYLDSAKTLKTRMEAILTKPFSCSELEHAIRNIQASHEAETERAQDGFHLEDEAKIQDDRKPLQGEIDINQTRLAALNSEIRGLEDTLHNLKRQQDTTHAGIDAVKAEMGKSGFSPPDCSQARTRPRIEALCQQYNAFVATNNALVDQHNGTVSRRNELAEEHNRLVAGTNRLIETLNWTR